MSKSTKTSPAVTPSHYSAVKAPTAAVAPAKAPKAAPKATRDLKNKEVRELIVVKNDANKTAWVSSKYAYKNATVELLVAKIAKRATNRTDAVANTYAQVLQGKLTIERTEILSVNATALTLDKWNELVAEGYVVAGRPPKGATAKVKEIKEVKDLTAEEVDTQIAALVARREALVK